MKQQHSPLIRTSRVGRCALAATLALTLAGTAPCYAFADAASAASHWNDAAAQMESPSYAPYSTQNENVLVPFADEGSAFATKYDLRDKGVVTPIKLQNPWGTCWGFSAVAASETSILSELGTTYAQTGLDLSERHLAYFAYTPVPDVFTDNPITGTSQEGEGVHSKYADPTSESYAPNYMFDLGGLMAYATTMFSAGIGVLSEEHAPYQNDEGYIICMVLDPETKEVSQETLNAKGIADAEAAGKQVTKMCYAPTIPAPTEEDPEATVPATWALSDDLWIASSYELEESSILPEIAVYDESGGYLTYSQEGVNAIKSEIQNHGRAVSIAFCADTSRPNEQGEAKYINENTWAHYTYEPASANHAVTIVGWDDEYPASNFNSGHQPEGNGAWLVKNSWGSDSEEFPNANIDGWGIDGDGYFWLSYYDQSICMPETFNFDLGSYTEIPDYLIDQYNYMLSGKTLQTSYETPAPCANVFTATEDRTVRTLTCETTQPNTKVTYEVYLLDENATSPTDGVMALAEPKQETYEYGGFHRMTLPEEEWVPMREGQRYAVVVTQEGIGANGEPEYYQSVASNKAKISDEALAELEAKMLESITGLLWFGQYDQYYQENIANGMTEEEAKADAENRANEFIESEAAKASIDSIVAYYVNQMTAVWYESVVNSGESYTSDGSEWADWSNVVAEMDTSGLVIDNFPIKAFADFQDYASVETLSTLEQKIIKAEQLLASVMVSADGSDVAEGSPWVTQAVYDEYATALAAAREILALSGPDYATTLVLSTPDQATVEAAVGSLDVAMSEFEGAFQMGTAEKPAKPEKPVKPEKPGSQNHGKTGTFAETADPTQAMVLFALCAGGIAILVLAGTAIARRRQH